MLTSSCTSSLLMWTGDKYCLVEGSLLKKLEFPVASKQSEVHNIADRRCRVHQPQVSHLWSRHAVRAENTQQTISTQTFQTLQRLIVFRPWDITGMKRQRCKKKKKKKKNVIRHCHNYVIAFFYCSQLVIAHLSIKIKFEYTVFSSLH